MSNTLIAVAVVLCSTVALAGERLSTVPPRETATEVTSAPATTAPTAAPKKKSKPISKVLGTSSGSVPIGLGTRGTGAVVRGSGTATPPSSTEGK